MSKIHNLMFFLVITLLAVITSAEAPKKDPYEGQSSMNGYTLKEFAGFENKWKLVTVRYRKDTGEMRFVYANPAALRALRRGDHEYPDGAVFGKIGFQTHEDSSFPSSVVPSGAKRFQFMIRHKARHGDTNGWGYALFNANGKTFPGEPKAVSQACAACHNIVANRGYIFSQPADFETSVFAHVREPARETSASETLKFRQVETEKLPPRLVEFLPPSEKKIMKLTGSLSKNIFQGTLDEIRPRLIQETVETGKPSALISDDGKMFSIVFKDRLNATCGQQTALAAVVTDPAHPDGIKHLGFCH